MNKVHKTIVTIKFRQILNVRLKPDYQLIFASILIFLLCKSNLLYMYKIRQKYLIHLHYCEQYQIQKKSKSLNKYHVCSHKIIKLLY